MAANNTANSVAPTGGTPVWLAKSQPYNNKPVTVMDHCVRCADMAAKFGMPLGLEDQAYLMLLAHDFGKRSPLFQAVLNKTRSGVDHALPGAAFLKILGAPDPVVQAVAGHHAGLLSYERLEPYIEQVLNDPGMPAGPFNRLPSIAGGAAFSAAIKDFAADVRTAGVARKTRAGQSKGWHYEPDAAWPEWKRAMYRMLSARFAMSLQADADYTVSAIEAGELDGGLAQPFMDPHAALERLYAYRNKIKKASNAGTAVNTLRGRVWRACGVAGRKQTAPGKALYTLTAPTGSGKTLGMLRFALERMRADPTRKRVVFVLPFLSLVDQTVDIIKNIIPDVVVDTSAVDHTGKIDRLMTETWDAACVVTTTVQFFGSLFSDLPGQCRKLHNLAESVLLFDEIQQLPLELSRVAMQGLAFLVSDYKACVLLSTATQPAYARLDGLDWTPREIIANPTALHAAAGGKRIEVMPGRPDIQSIATTAAAHSSVCVVCNLKRHTRAVYAAWKTLGLEGAYFLSSDMCMAHRRKVIRKIKARQNAGKPVRLASTQCVEAGVDLDFEFMYRALAPLTAILQAAGRQDRNGNWPNGKTFVFEPKDDGKGMCYPDAGYARQAMVVKEMLAAGADLSGFDAVETYYTRLFAGFEDPKAIRKALREEDYPGFSDASRLIRHDGWRVVVPYGDSDQIAAYQNLLCAVYSESARKSHLACTGAISTTTYDYEGLRSHCAEVLFKNPDGTDRHTGTFVLLPDHISCYSEETGLDFGQDVPAII